MDISWPSTSPSTFTSNLTVQFLFISNLQCPSAKAAPRYTHDTYSRPSSKGFPAKPRTLSLLKGKFRSELATSRRVRQLTRPYHYQQLEHCKIHFRIYILRPHPTKATKGSKATDNEPRLLQGLVSWPKLPVKLPKGSNSDLEANSASLSPCAANCSSLVNNNSFSLAFQTNPMILTHVQNWVDPDTRYNSKGYQVPELPLVLTIDIYPDFVKQLAIQTESEVHDSEHGTKQQQLSDDEDRAIDILIEYIEDLTTSTEVIVAKALENSIGHKDIRMTNIAELEQGLNHIMKTRPELGVNYHWGFREPVHGFRGPKGVKAPYMFREMIPRTRVEMLRKENRRICEDRWICGCGRQGYRLYG